MEELRRIPWGRFACMMRVKLNASYLAAERARKEGKKEDDVIREATQADIAMLY